MRCVGTLIFSLVAARVRRRRLRAQGELRKRQESFDKKTGQRHTREACVGINAATGTPAQYTTVERKSPRRGCYLVQPRVRASRRAVRRSAEIMEVASASHQYLLPPISPNASWLSCIDRSRAATAAYVRAVYRDSRALADFDWSTLQVLFTEFLRTNDKDSLRDCLLQDERVYKKVFMHVMWLNYRTQKSLGLYPHEHYINRGSYPAVKSSLASRRLHAACKPVTWGWLEVLHMPSWSQSRPYQKSWGNQLWMYVVRGSGLWYHAGRTLLCSDTIDLVNYLNYSKYSARTGDTKPPLFEEAISRLNGSFDSISFTTHVDGACCFRMAMHEIISLAGSSMRCPVSDRMRRGWPPNFQTCSCTGNRISQLEVC